MDFQKRNLNIDLIKSVAVIFVLSIHFFLHIDFYNTPIIGIRMTFLTVLRNVFIICVPLFLTTTGYLMCRKNLSANYYRGIGKTIFLYLICSIVCIIYKQYSGIASYTIKTSFWAILDFSAANYSWYIEMYIGLFLLIPFLNLIYQNLSTANQKRILLVTLFFICSFSNFISCFTKYEFSIFPDYWSAFYPLFYYFLGSYFREYPIKISSFKIFLLFILWLGFCSLFNLYFFYGNTFGRTTYVDYYGFQTAISTAIFFSFLQNISLKKCPLLLKKMIVKISELSLGIYLISYIFDNKFYPILNEHVPIVRYRLNYFVIMVLCVFICSAILSQLINWLYQLWHFCYLKIKEQLGKHLKSPS